MWLVNNKCPTLTGGVFFYLFSLNLCPNLKQIWIWMVVTLRNVRKKLNWLRSSYYPRSSLKTKKLSYTDVFLFWPLFHYFLVLGSKFCNFLALYGSRSCQKLFCTHLGIPEMILGQNIQMSYTDVFISLPLYLY